MPVSNPVVVPWNGQFDHFPQSGAACFDFRGLRVLSASRGKDGGAPLPIAPVGLRMCAGSTSASSKKWWTTLGHETGAHCTPNPELSELITLTARMYVGFAVKGKVFRDTTCDQPAVQPTLTMHGTAIGTQKAP